MKTFPTDPRAIWGHTTVSRPRQPHRPRLLALLALATTSLVTVPGAAMGFHGRNLPAAAPAPAPARNSAEPAEPPTPSKGRPEAPRPPSEHANPRLKVGLRTLAIRNVDGKSAPLSALELDSYPLSRRWIRGGIRMLGGMGQATMAGNDVDLTYAMVGAAGGVQYPARITPFVEGNLAGGALWGSLDRPLVLPGVAQGISGGGAVTWVRGYGVDIGTEVYTVGRAFVSTAFGWLHTTWSGPDLGASASAGALRLTDLTTDTLTLKLALGI